MEKDKRTLWREQKQEYRKSRKEYTIILSLDEATQLEQYALVKGMSPTELVKALIKSYEGDSAYILPKEHILKELVIEIRRIGNNINQLVRYCNTNKSVSVQSVHALQQQLTALEQTINVSLTNPPKA